MSVLPRKPPTSFGQAGHYEPLKGVSPRSALIDRTKFYFWLGYEAESL